MKKITLTKVWNYAINRVRLLIPRRSLRYIDWMLHGDNTIVYGGLSFKVAYNQVFGNNGGGIKTLSNAS